MLNTILGFVNAKVQYELHKRTGGVAIIGFAIILFIIMLWDDWFFPLFNTLGLVYIFTKAGLVVDNPAQSALNIFFTMLALLLIISLIILFFQPFITILYIWIFIVTLPYAFIVLIVGFILWILFEPKPKNNN